MFIVIVSLVMSQTFGCYESEIIPHPHLVTNSNAVVLLASEDLTDM